jgi:hypothetical protein
MKNTKLALIAGATLGLALSLGACDKKSDETPSSVGQAPAPDKTTPEQAAPSPQGSSTDPGTPGSSGMQDKKPEDASKSQKG